MLPCPDPEPRLWAAPSVLTLNKLCAGSSESPGAGIISFSDPAQVAGPTHGDNPASRGLLRCPGQDQPRRRLPCKHVGLWVHITPGDPVPARPQRNAARVCRRGFARPSRSLCFRCRLPGLSGTRRFFPSLFSFFSAFFFLPPRETCTETDGFILHESLMI